MGTVKRSRKDKSGVVLPSNVSQLSDMRYIWRKTINGSQYVLVDKNLKELKRKITQKEADIQNGISSELDKSTLNEWFYKWIDIYKGNIKSITKTNYLNYWKWYVSESKLGKMKIAKIKRTNVIELYKELSINRELSYGTIKYVDSLIHSCLQDAVSDDLLLKNPSIGALGKIKKTDNKERQALTIEQQSAFIDFISSNNIYKIYLPLFSFLLGTGCRLGETLGITWNNIDLENNIIHIEHTLSYKKLSGSHRFFITTPKTKNSIRQIPILDDLKIQLLFQKRLQYELGIDKSFEISGYRNFVFTTSTGKPYTQEAVNRIIKSIVNAHNKQEKELAMSEGREERMLPIFSAHTLRHTFCTRFCENESDVKVIQKIMGHSRIDTTLNIYTHVTQNRVDEVMVKLNGKIKIS